MNLPNITLLTSPDWKDYELVDSGNGFKLERFGTYYFKRPEPEAIWKPNKPAKIWDQIHAEIGSKNRRVFLIRD
mgnify:CR=1 FL=1